MPHSSWLLSFQVAHLQLTAGNFGFNTVALTVSDASCNVSSCTTTVELKDDISGLHNPQAGLAIKVYPNPSTGLFELRMDEGLVCERVEIFNTFGQLILEDRTSAALITFDLSWETSVCYYLRAQTGGAARVLKLTLVR